MPALPKRDRRCWVVSGYAPEGTTMAEANDQWNAYVADVRRGPLLFHDHFADARGGIAVFAPETPEELAAIRDKGPLTAWDLRIHPLIFAEGANGFLFQMDYTMIAYRKRKLADLYAAYVASDEGKRNAARGG
ncbi:MAG TPA: hypothetical protein VFY93_07195 [Planctomycetota bacterium]|nr:hypothetical protein [Planctomycetota bacterium]